MSRLNFFEIIVDGNKSMKQSTNKKIFVLYYYLVPLLISICIVCTSFFISSDTATNVIGGFGLFAGLMFTLLFVITGNFDSRKRQFKDSKLEEDTRYIKTYQDFTNNSISLISYSILKSGLIIILLLLYTSLISIITKDYVVIIEFVQGLIILQLLQYAMVFIAILKDMYAMLYEDVNK
jgi:hypothetical protein